jgi:carboxyl-terminal processing protease
MNPRKLLLVGLLVIFSGYTGYLIGVQKLKFSYRNWKPAVVVNQNPPGTNKVSQADFALFWTVWDKLQSNYVDKSMLDPKKMIDGAIGGMVAAVGDPYTAYLPVQQNKESKEDLGGAFEGVGLQLGFDKNNRLSVVTPLEGSPGYKAGVKTGDVILHIKDDKNGVDRTTDGMTLPEAVKLIRGQKGTKVQLTFAREGVEKPMVLDLTRDTIVVKSVTWEYKQNGGKKVAWIKLNRFGDRTNEEWSEAISDVINQKDQVKGIVLDVRNNPGGYLEGAVYIASEFLSPGKIVVTQQYGDGEKIENKVERNGRLLNIPLVVLVNKGSASAAEILSGALQDYGRAKIYGVQSFGKGSVQQPEDFPDGSGVHITVARWLRPSGDWIDKKGITPDVKVEMPQDVNSTEDPQLDKAVQAF